MIVPFTDMEKTWEVVGRHLWEKNSKSSIVPMATPAVADTLDIEMAIRW